MSQQNKKNVKVELIHRHDIEQNWNLAVNFKPNKAEIVVYDMYDKDGNKVADHVRYKIGDGINFINDLPFISAGQSNEISGEIFNDYDRNFAEKDCHAEGSGTEALRGYAHAEGFGTKAYWRSHAQGFYTHARADSMAGGRMSYAAGPGSVAFGIEWNEDFSSTVEAVSLKTGTVIKSVKLFDDSHIGCFVCLHGLGLNSDGSEISILTDCRKIISVNGNEATIDRPFYEPLQPTYSEIQNQDEFIIGQTAVIKIASPCEATGVASFSFGCATKATGNRAFTSGQETVAAGSCASAMNNKTQALGDNSHAEGNSTIAGKEYYKVDEEGNYLNENNEITTNPEEYIVLSRDGNGAHAEGFDTKAIANYSHAEGRKTQAIKPMAHAEGNDTLASGESSHAEGGGAAYNLNGVTQKLVASGIYSHAEGQGTTSSARASHSEGEGSLAEGEASHAEGFSTYASYRASHAEGTYTSATNVSSHAEGNYSVASGAYSHAEGTFISDSSVGQIFTESNGVASHAEGGGTRAFANYSHTEGWKTYVAPGAVCSHAEGSNNQALHEGVHVEGAGNISGDSYQHICGKYNDVDDSYGKTFVVGIGTHNSNRVNGFTIDKLDGTVHSTGNIIADKDVYAMTSDGTEISLSGINGAINIEKSERTEECERILNLSKEYAESYADSKISDLVNGASDAYNTLMDIQKALEEDDNVASSLTTQITEVKQSLIGKKYPSSSGGAGGEIFNIYSGVNANIASGNFSHAEGWKTEATATCSHAEGTRTRAAGDSSHAGGIGCIALGRAEYVSGKYNDFDIEYNYNNTVLDRYAFVVGNGQQEDIFDDNGNRIKKNRSNAHTLDWNGNAWYSGHVTANKGFVLKRGVSYGTQEEFDAMSASDDLPDGSFFIVF